MTFCFDLDDTISASPRTFGALMHSLKKAGHEVFVVTGSHVNEPVDKQERLAQLSRLGVEPREDFDDVIICSGKSMPEIGEKKADFAKREYADLFVDDSDTFLSEIMKKSPETLCLRVENP